MVTNAEIRRLFDLYAELLLLHDKDQRLAGLLSGAAYRIRNRSTGVMDAPAAELAKEFRPPIVRVLKELKRSSTIAALDELIQLTPQGIFEMMRIRGLGGKKLSVLWKKAGIDSIDALLAACKKHIISEMRGFGPKTEANIVRAIEDYRVNEDRFHYASVADIARSLVEQLRKVLKTNLVELCGEVRRQCLTVAGIEMLMAVPAKSLQKSALRKLLVIESTSKNETKGHTLDEIPLTIYLTTRLKFHAQLFIRTGSESHVKKVLAKVKEVDSFPDEAAIYKKAKLPFIVPEMREDVAEWNFKQPASQLITAEDIRGVVHNHTDWSDGIDPLADFAQACKIRGYEYTVISDHSKNAHYAGGLKEKQVMQQMKQIDELNKQLKPFKIFKSIECDILVTGELDLPNELLTRFDLVIVSVHQLLKMDEARATKRLIKAIENQHTTILGHISGRQLLIRPGYPLNYKKVIDACAANHVIIEVNANPYRLDIDWTHIPYALHKGVMISINPDAHSIAEIDNIRWGVSAARKGGLTKEMTWNAMPLKKVEQWLARRNKKGQI
jgi:DNA polymerase (family 10)